MIVGINARDSLLAFASQSNKRASQGSSLSRRAVFLMIELPRGRIFYMRFWNISFFFVAD
jgi:hypothetical protein